MHIAPAPISTTDNHKASRSDALPAPALGSARDGAAPPLGGALTTTPLSAACASAVKSTIGVACAGVAIVAAAVTVPVAVVVGVRVDVFDASAVALADCDVLVTVLVAAATTSTVPTMPANTSGSPCSSQ
jgi:hypothetical protein